MVTNYSYNSTPIYREDAVSQVPALFLLARLGYEYVSPREALRLRGGRVRNVILNLPCSSGSWTSSRGRSDGEASEW